MVRRSQAEVEECFRACYRADRTDVHIRFERLVFGSDFGAGGWTTLEQADELTRRRDLRAASVCSTSARVWVAGANLW